MTIEIVKIEKYLKEMMEVNYIPALSISMVYKNEPILQSSYGLINLKTKAKATNKSVFEIASITKLFTAVAVMILFENHQLNLEDKLGKFLQDIPKLWQKITIQQLLTHSSGIISYTDMANYKSMTGQDLSKEGVLNLVSNEELLFKPGTKWSYSNTGYYLLGILVELISNLSYEEFLYNNIFIPSQMHSTYINKPKLIIENKANGYKFIEGSYQKLEYYSPSFTFSSGAILSTIQDLSSWFLALKEGKLIQKQSLELMWSSKINGPNNNFQMGLGWYILDYQINNSGHKAFAHNGYAPGFSSDLIYIPEKDLFIIALCNLDSFDLHSQISKIMHNHLI